MADQPRPDPLLDEIQRIRREISDQFGTDVHRLGRHLRQLHERFTDRPVRRPRKGHAPDSTARE